MPALVAQLDARLTGDQEVARLPGPQHSFMEIDFGLFCTVPSTD